MRWCRPWWESARKGRCSSTTHSPRYWTAAHWEVYGLLLTFLTCLLLVVAIVVLLRFPAGAARDTYTLTQTGHTEKHVKSKVTNSKTPNTDTPVDCSTQADPRKCRREQKYANHLHAINEVTPSCTHWQAPIVRIRDTPAPLLEACCCSETGELLPVAVGIGVVGLGAKWIDERLVSCLCSVTACCCAYCAGRACSDTHYSSSGGTTTQPSGATSSC